VVQGRCRISAAVAAQAVLQAWQVVHPADLVDPADPVDRVNLAAPEAQG
jgi:hypothetical protein